MLALRDIHHLHFAVTSRQCLHCLQRVENLFKGVFAAERSNFLRNLPIGSKFHQRQAHPAANFTDDAQRQEAHDEAPFDRRLAVRSHRLHVYIRFARHKTFRDCIATAVRFNGRLRVALHCADAGKKAKVAAFRIDDIVISLQFAFTRAGRRSLKEFQPTVLAQRIALLFGAVRSVLPLCFVLFNILKRHGSRLCAIFRRQRSASFQLLLPRPGAS